MKDRQGVADDSLELSTFQQPAETAGISLEQLNAAFAQMLGQGSSPYEETRDLPRFGGLVLGDEALRSDATQTAADSGVTPRGIVEAMLFVGSPTNEPLTSERLASPMRGVRPAEIDDLVRELNAEYRAHNCPYEIGSVGAGYRLVIRADLAAIRDRVYSRNRRVRLSPAAIEVLSVVAYNQPITTAEIDRLRGRASGSLLRQLVRRQLLLVERAAAPSRTPHYRTTERFLELFGLASLDELPKHAEIDRR